MSIDIEALRDHLTELCGTANASGIAPVLMVLSDIERADPYELIRIAEMLGVDTRFFSSDGNR